MNLDVLLAEYSKQISNQWELVPQNEGDILNIVAIRDDIHEAFGRIADPAASSKAGDKIKHLDQYWQSWIKTNTDGGFKMDYPAGGNHWWYNLDKLDSGRFDLNEI
jgi:hypothetical protein